MGYFTIALVGGHSIAGERTERAAEFFAYLPVPRSRSAVPSWRPCSALPSCRPLPIGSTLRWVTTT